MDTAMEDCLDLESDAQMVGAARRFVQERLRSWEESESIQDALLVTSELITNAVLHARTSIQLRIVSRDGIVRIEVFDENSRLPIQSPCPADATSGRGLALVAALASAWGMEHRGDGKIVWAEIGRARPAPVSADCVDLSEVDTVEEAFERIRRSETGPRPAPADSVGHAGAG